MTALFVVVLITAFVAVDQVVVTLRKRKDSPGLPRPPIPTPRPPSDVFVDAGHCWARLTPRGVNVGVDELITTAMGEVERIHAPPPGTRVERGAPLLELERGGHRLILSAPMSGEVLWHNMPTLANPRTVLTDPYGAGWVVALTVQDSKTALEPLHLGDGATSFLGQEHRRLTQFFDGNDMPDGIHNRGEGRAPPMGALALLDHAGWKRFQQRFLDRTGSTP